MGSLRHPLSRPLLALPLRRYRHPHLPRQPQTYIPPFPFAVLSVIVAILGSVQAIVKPSDKFHRDIEFRDEADYFYRLCLATNDPAEVMKIMTEFEQVERRFHLGEHPWPVPKRDSKKDTAQPGHIH